METMDFDWGAWQEQMESFAGTMGFAASALKDLLTWHLIVVTTTAWATARRMFFSVLMPHWLDFFWP